MRTLSLIIFSITQLHLSGQSGIFGKYILSKEAGPVEINLDLKSDSSFSYFYHFQYGDAFQKGHWKKNHDTIMLFKNFSDEETETTICLQNNTVDKGKMLIQIVNEKVDTSINLRILINGYCTRPYMIKRGQVSISQQQINFIQIGPKKFMVSDPKANVIKIELAKIWRVEFQPAFTGAECWLYNNNKLNGLNNLLQPNSIKLFKDN